jgi:AraC-like DNA-binding protein
VFKLGYGITPNRYIISKKLEYAKQLLDVGYLPIAEVADMAGFTDVYYFSKQFKLETGITPGNYKKDDK